MAKKAHELDLPSSILSDPPGPAQADLHAQLMLQRLRGALIGSPERATIGRFEIDGVLGSGGMGVVYAATDPTLGRPVAVKVVERGESDHQRLLQEARALARVRHAAVVQVYEADVLDDAVYIAMERVDGKQLDAWLDSERPDSARIVEVFRAAGEGLATAHTAGVVHGDFKPSNVLVDDAGNVKVIDFGLARIATESPMPAMAGDGSATSGLTVAGAGTPAYMAPEQLAGERADVLSDQFSFCVALFEALSGQRPFFGATAEQYRQRVREGELDTNALHKIPTPLRAALRRGLASEPASRYASMSALLTALSPRRRRTHWFAAIAVLAVIAVAAGYVATRRGRGTTATRSAGATASAERDAALPSRSAVNSPPPAATSQPVATTPTIVAVTPSSSHIDDARPPLPKPRPTPLEVGPTRIKSVVPARSARVKPARSRKLEPAPSARVVAPPPPRSVEPARSAATPSPAAPPAAATPAPPTADELRRSAHGALAAADGLGCLHKLDAAQRITGYESPELTLVRARCEMLSGRCSAGKRRWLATRTTMGASTTQADKELVRLAPAPCRPAPPPLDVRVVTLRKLARAAAHQGATARCDTLLEQARSLAPLAQAAGILQQQAVAHALESLANCLAKGRRCSRALVARRRYLELNRASDANIAAARWLAQHCR